MANPTTTVSRTEVRAIMKQLDTMEIKLMKLKSRLLPTEEITAKEKKELEAAKEYR